MNRISILLAGTILSAGLMPTAAFAQSTGDSSPVPQVEGQPPATGDENVAAGQSVETKAPNAPDQTPAFPEQTRAPQPGVLTEITQTKFAEGLPQLWSMELLSEGRVLVAAKAGALHIIAADGTAGPEIDGVPEVAFGGQGGLLDVALAPDFETSGMIFFSFSEPRDGGNGTSVASAILVQDDAGGGMLEDVKVIFQQMPTYDGDKHFGSRLVFGPEGELYVTVGERSDPGPRVQAQDVSSGLGKVFRIDTTGAAFKGNPLVDQEGALPEIWSYGHRNMQAAGLDGQGRLWTVEHGPRGGDELNRPEAGKNYGWPVITYGLDYSGAPIGEGVTAMEGMEQPVYYWDPVIGPSGMVFYDGAEFPEWDGSFVIGGLVTTGLVVVHLEDDRVAFEERVSLDARVRDVKVGPDGEIYALTENPRASTSEIIRVTRAD